MSYKHFSSFNVIGGIAWIVIFTTLGALIGRIEWIEKNLDIVVILIIFISILPGVYEVVKAKWASKKTKHEK
jgi:membrane-associated protein